MWYRISSQQPIENMDEFVFQIFFNTLPSVSDFKATDDNDNPWFRNIDLKSYFMTSTSLLKYYLKIDVSINAPDVKQVETVNYNKDVSVFTQIAVPVLEVHNQSLAGPVQSSFNHYMDSAVPLDELYGEPVLFGKKFKSPYLAAQMCANWIKTFEQQF